MIARIKANDVVVVVSGKNKGEQGSVIEILPKEEKVMVKGVAIVTRHVKPRKQGEVGGIKKQETYIRLSQVMPLCTSCKKPCRVFTKEEAGKRVRACNRCKEIL